MSTDKQSNNSIIQLEDLRLLLKLFTRDWYWFIILPLLFGSLSFLYAYRLTNIYSAKSQLILKSNDYNQLDGGFSNPYSSFEETANQIRVVKSSNLLEKVIQKMNLNVSYFIQGRLKTSEVFKNMPFEVTSENYGNKSYYRDFNIKILSAQEYELTFLMNDEEVVKKYRFDELVLDYGFHFKILKSTSISSLDQSSIESLPYYKFYIYRNEDLIYKYKSAMTVENEEWTSILNITVQDEIADRAVMFLDTLARVYIDYSLQNRFDINSNTYVYISNQLEEVVEIINSIEKEIELYKASKQILNIEKEQENYFKQLVDSETEKKKIKLKIAAISDLKNHLINSENSDFLPPSYYILKEDNFIQDAISKLYDIEVKKSNYLMEGTNQTFTISSVDKNIEILKKNLLTHLINSEKYLSEQIEDQNYELIKYKNKLQIIPQNQRQLLNIQRKLEVNEKLYLFLLEKRAENIISKAGIISETKVIEKARSFGIIWPNRQKIIATYTLAGLVLAFLIGLIRQLFFQRITNLAELDQATSLPVLGGIPLMKSEQLGYLAVEQKPKGALSESFRNLRANLQYLSAEKPSKVIMVTSVHPSEGKTFCSVNLATILAKADKKVIVIDFDMHKPRVHQAFGLNKNLGLSNYLIGDKVLSEVIQPTSVENLSTILSGPVPPNPSELVLGAGVGVLVEQLSKSYDYVILDTPPLALISDGAILLNKYADVGIFVSHTKFANKNALSFLGEIAEKNKEKSVGLILNGIYSNKWRYYYGKYEYNYAYSYGYGYGYTYGSEKED